MAKKQQIILTHGSANPGAEVVKGLKLGEVLVQHADTAVDARLHTLLKEGEEGVADPVLVSFPSKDYVDAEIAKVDAGGINSTITAIDNRVKAVEDDYLKAADKKELSDAIDAEAKDRDAADKAIEAKLGAGFDAENTVAAAIDAEAKDRDDADIALQNAIDKKVETSVYNQKMGEIDADIADLESLLSGFEGEGAVKTAVDSKVAQDAYDIKMGTVDKTLEGLQDQFDALNETFYTEDEIDGMVGDLNEDIDAAKTALTEADPEEGVKVVKATETDGHDVYTITAVGLATETEMNAVEGRLDAIEGDDSGKSMRTVAKAEVDSFKDLLYGEGAAGVIDTLQDVINWIDSDESGATKIVADIADLQKVTSGYTGEKAIQNAYNALDVRVKAVEDDYLKAADKTELSNAIDAEAKDRDDADKAIEAKLGEGFTEENTVAAAIDAEADVREKADIALQNAIDKLDEKFYTEGEIDSKIAEINSAIAEAKVNISGVNADGVGVFVTETEDAEDGHFSYTIEAKGLATSAALGGAVERIETLEGTYVKEVVANGVDCPIVNNVLDLSALVIDGGEY